MIIEYVVFLRLIIYNWYIESYIKITFITSKIMQNLNLLSIWHNYFKALMSDHEIIFTVALILGYLKAAFFLTKALAIAI